MLSWWWLLAYGFLKLEARLILIKHVGTSPRGSKSFNCLQFWLPARPQRKKRAGNGKHTKNWRDVCKIFDVLRYYFIDGKLIRPTERRINASHAVGGIVAFLDWACFAPRPNIVLRATASAMANASHRAIKNNITTKNRLPSGLPNSERIAVKLEVRLGIETGIQHIYTLYVQHYPNLRRLLYTLMN